LIKSVCLISGPPGSGKTSIIKQMITTPGIKAGGFFTEEIRTGVIREGFRLVTIDGDEALLAHMGIRSPNRIGKYGVDLSVMDNLAVNTLIKAAAANDIIVIDEIGKMELLSRVFKSTVLAIIESGKRVLGTIMLKSDPWADMIKQKAQVELFMLSRYNRTEVSKHVEEWLRS
jgi:nucleoside-triphosphatase